MDGGSPMQISTPNEDPVPRVLQDAIGVNLAVDVDGAPEHLQQGLQQIIGSHNVAYFAQTSSAQAEHVWSVQFEHTEDVASGTFDVRSVTGQVPQITVRYNRTIDAFRALGQVLTAARAAEVAALTNPDALQTPDFTISESAQFETLALMIDCSRNGVLNVNSVRAMLRNMALMGYTMLQLYTEDTYKVEGEPFFGYLRGGYTHDELRAIDDYAFAMGIEVVACIQTLGHLGQMLQWPRYAGLRDTNEVILSRAPETYAFLEKLIKAASAPLRSKRIHIGMDEAYGVGEGRFRGLYGQVEGTAIFVEHLGRVHAICAQLGLRAMIWSDMLFCLAAKNNALYAYYDQSNNPAEALSRVEGIPRDIDLVFWDYYHTQPEIYARKIQQHKDLGCSSPWMAGGAWTWSRLWCHVPFSFESNRASLIAAKSQPGRVASFMLTIWGDEGNECDFFSALPVMLYVANHAHTDKSEIDAVFMENAFAAVCGGSLGDWMAASGVDELPQPNEARAQMPSNMSKWLLWEDPMLSFMSPQYAGLALDEHYAGTASRLLDCALAPNTRYPLNRLLRMPGLLARVLSLKCNLRDRLARPYKAGDRTALLQVAETRLRPLIEAQRELWLYHRARWMRIYKPFGWETLELRYGGLAARLHTMYDRIVAYALCLPCSALRKSRAVGVAAGVSRHPALLPGRSRLPSLTVPFDSAGDVSGPSMSADAGSGLSMGEVPAWLPSITSADSSDDPAAMSMGLGWPVTACTSSLPACTIPACGPLQSHADTNAPAPLPVLTALPATSDTDNVTTINALGVRELGGEGDFWLQPAPLLPPELDPQDSFPRDIGCLGEEDMGTVIDSIPELEEDLLCIYENSYTSLLLDYGRVTAPSRLG
ncbi:hypothetical protein GGH15_001865 [Coemansia sp. RSA 562]|nr:hypothetical protein GGH15_001865 [Coemansia sp. RSA 562]KAJ2191439.1 hypothetical protein EV181_000261 [Coemansia sp. RSA 532]KAJ2274478.1 hypothetical protein J3F81_002223 [Coemansia sp. RSA 371]KAJ2292919.1 hypothetical protein IW141_001523 [Coemansia sp. RSA 355]